MLEIGKGKPGCARFRVCDSALFVGGALLRRGSAATLCEGESSGRASGEPVHTSRGVPFDGTGATDPSRNTDQGV